jgi:hypothetical protein
MASGKGDYYQCPYNEEILKLSTELKTLILRYVLGGNVLKSKHRTYSGKFLKF